MLFLAPVIALTLAGPARAGDVTIRIFDAAGQPVDEAVVTIKPAAGIPAGQIRFPWPTTMVQQDIMFVPHVLIVPVGATVQFPNKDKVRHHIYSFSKPAKFDLKLFGRDESRSYTFTTAGTVAIGCNIHDMMSGFIKVVDTPFAGKSSDGGSVVIDHVSGGAATLTVWHPRLRGKANEVSFQLTIPASGRLAKRIDLPIK